MHAGETMHCKPCYNALQNRIVEFPNKSHLCIHNQLEAMYFVEVVVQPAILFSPKTKVAARKTAIYWTVRVHFRKFRWQRFLYNIAGYRIAGATRCCYFADLCSYFKPFCIINAAWFWCAYTARGTSEYLPIMRSWFAAELSECLNEMADVNNVVGQRWFD